MNAGSGFSSGLNVRGLQVLAPGAPRRRSQARLYDDEGRRVNPRGVERRECEEGAEGNRVWGRGYRGCGEGSVGKGVWGRGVNPIL